MKTLVAMLAGLLVMNAVAESVPDNAALYYWKAIGLMRPPRTPDQLEAVRFVEEDLPFLSPRIFDARPAILNWLLSEQAVRDALRDATRCRDCDFGVRRRSGPFLDLSHLPRLAALTRRLCSMAQALEYAGRSDEAAQVYAGLLVMIRRLESDKALASGLATGDMMQQVLGGLEGFLSGNPSAQALAYLTDVFREAGAPLIRPGACLRAEAERISAWLLRDVEAAAKDLAARTGNSPLAPAVARMKDAVAGGNRSVIERWAAEYKAGMDQRAGAFEMPFSRGGPVLAGLDADRAARLENPGEAPNPLMVLLAPATTEIHQRILLANAQWDLAALLCAAAEIKARTGNWPADAAVVAPTLGRPPPTDPFSGAPMHYRLLKGGPVLGVRVPRAMADTGRWIYELDLARRAKEDVERTRNVMRQARMIEFEDLFEPVAP